MAFLDVLTENTDKFICFDENHKNWPIWSNEGVISKLYGTIVHLAKSELFILIIFAIIVSLFYITPRFQQLIRSKESYQSFMEKHIWSRGRELYDTFGLPIKPTVEEQMLVSLYFQYELYPSEVYNLFLQQKLSSISLKNFKADEIEVFHEILKRKMDYKTFMFMFKELEKIEERRNIYANS